MNLPSITQLQIKFDLNDLYTELPLVAPDSVYRWTLPAFSNMSGVCRTLTCLPLQVSYFLSQVKAAWQTEKKRTTLSSAVIK